ncbi:MAG: hypothetical protein MJ159_07280 [Treponemataceae bacterium]|nr:hypothetical protein [Treponemataceae bacterium]
MNKETDDTKQLSLGEEAALKMVCTNLFNADPQRISVHKLNTQNDVEDFVQSWKCSNLAGTSINAFLKKHE